MPAHDSAHEHRATKTAPTPRASTPYSGSLAPVAHASRRRMRGQACWLASASRAARVLAYEWWPGLA
eukprot:6496837-Alexandrium_andersonii.AAC.1